jgi:two-component system OmpR family response regulator
MTPLRVLYVEDEDDIRSIATMVMESIGGFTVRVCSSGTEALQAAPEFHPDLMVLDVMMPGMNGPETLARLRALPVTAATPVIFMTAKMQSSEIKAYMDLGALGVIDKPFDPMTMALQIEELWKTHLSQGIPVDPGVHLGAGNNGGGGGI